MPNVNGTANNDTWTVVTGGSYVVDGLGGIDTLNLGTSTRSDYSIKPLSDGGIQIDTVSGASSSFHATLYNMEKLVFSSNRDTISLQTGTANGDTITGATGDDIINALGGDDSLTGNAGNDTIDGGAGYDVANFGTKLANYTVKRVGTTTTIKSKTGTDGTDTATNVESLKFNDMTVNLTVKAIAASAPAANVQKVIELYVAFFKRVPDADGMAYWISEMNAGKSITQIADAFYNAGLAFPELTGFTPQLTNTDFVNLIYRNVLGRVDGADAEGLAYWTGKLADGSATKSSLVIDILFGAHSFKGDATFGWVADLLDNKIAVAKTFSVDMGLGYVSANDNILHGMEIAAAVTPTNTSNAITLIGVSATDIVL